jgi:preprotein translocase subunit SecG
MAAMLALSAIILHSGILASANSPVPAIAQQTSDTDRLAKIVAFLVIVFLAVISVIIVLSRASQTPAESSQQQQKPPSLPTLLVSCDLSCDWTLDGNQQGHIEENQTTVISLPLGRHLIVANSTDGIAHSEKTVDVRSVAPTTLNFTLAPIRSARLLQYYSAYEDRNVIYLRSVFNKYLYGQNENESEYELLRKWDRSYYQSKFIVLSLDSGALGGVWITIMFQDHPDRIFSAWVYSNETYQELRALNSPDRSEQDMEKVRIAFKQFLEDREHAL